MMKDILVSNDIIPVGQFKSGLAKYLKEEQSKRNSLIITQNGKPAGVLISPSEFDDLRQTKLFSIQFRAVYPIPKKKKFFQLRSFEPNCKNQEPEKVNKIIMQVSWSC
jgi:prevent-host-death family protein